jgi:hypothetical protein
LVPEDLKNHPEALFDSDSYSQITDFDMAFSCIRYFSKKVNNYRGQLASFGWSAEEIDAQINKLWTDILTACRKFGVPLTTEGKLAAKRLGL